MNYCSNCGTKVEGNYCTNCGAKVGSNEENNVQYNNVVNTNTQNKTKNNYDGYRIAVGIIMIIIGGLVLLGGLDKSTRYSLTETQIYTALIIPGLITLISGILSVVSKTSNILLLISGILYYIAAIINLSAIHDISILFILCVVFGSLNIAFYAKTNN